MANVISKSEFKPRALHYFREVEKKGLELIITDPGKPVIKIVPFFEDTEKALKKLRNSVLEYREPTEPVGLKDWEMLR